MSAPVRVLHVDDDSAVAELTATYLERIDDRIGVETATSPTRGIDLLADDDYDCVVSDYEMPEMNGIEFLENVRDRHADLPFILFTGKGSEVVAGEAISAGVTDYLRKRSDTNQYELLANRIRNYAERTRVERERERHLNAIETAQEGISILDDDGEFVYVNDAYADLYGHDPDGMVGESWELIYPESEIPRVTEELLPAVETTGSWQGETTGLRADGSTFPERHSLTKTGDGELVCTVRDIGEQKKYETRVAGLHRATRRLMAADTEQAVAERTAEAAENILDFPLTVVRLLDGETLVPVVVSDAIGAEIGHDRPAYEVGQPTAGVAFERDEPVIFDDLDDLDDGIDHVNGAGMYVPIGDHGVLTISATEAAAFDGSDVEVAEILASNAEAALDRVAQTQELRRRNEHLEKVVSLVAHDLRNPLEVAIGRLGLAKSTGENHHLDAVERAHDRIEALTDDLVTLARGGDRVGDTEPVALAETVESSWETVVTEDASLVVTTDRAVRADRDRFRRLVENLLRNAVVHGGHDVTVTVGDCDGGFYVADDGPGVPEDERERVFESGYSTTETGTGFGLSIVREIATVHGWETEVTESDDGGARFEFTGVDGVD